jgi:hypothetical protein
MVKFKKGDRAQCTCDSQGSKCGDIVTIDENDGRCAFVITESGRRVPMFERNLKLLTPIVQTENASREGQWVGILLEQVAALTGAKLEFTCECGKDKHGFAKHASWCPKHD